MSGKNSHQKIDPDFCVELVVDDQNTTKNGKTLANML